MTYYIYGKENCPYCVKAKDLLDSKGLPYEYIDVEHDKEARQFIKEVLGAKTVPQVFLSKEVTEHVGGYQDLLESFYDPFDSMFD